MYTDILELVMVLSLISTATERVVEILKPFININEKYKTAIYSCLSISISALVYVISELHSIKVSNYGVEVLLIALSCGAGAGFWHNILQVVTSLKISK